jgi:hypothetical protein
LQSLGLQSQDFEAPRQRPIGIEDHGRRGKGGECPGNRWVL